MSHHAGRTPLVLQSAQEVRDLLSAVRTGRQPPRRPVRIEAHGIPDEHRRQIEGRLTGAAMACGCAQGNVAAGLALVGYTLYLLVAVGSPAGLGLRHLAWGAGLCVGAAVAAKLVALGRARSRFVSELGRLLVLLGSAPAPSPAHGG